jgi:hypothetical protein
VTAPGDLADRASPPGTADLRIVLMQALGILTPRARAVVVPRYWEDGASTRSRRCSAARPATSPARALGAAVLSVQFVRPDRRVSATFTAMNYFVTGDARGPASAAPPARMAALAAAAQDLRWGWTVNSGFVAHAQQLRLGGDSGQAWH